MRHVAVVVSGTVLAVGLGVSGSVLWALGTLSRSLPAGHLAEAHQSLSGSTLYDETDHVIAELRAERRILVPLTRIPKILRDAVVAIEDARFRSHIGVDPIGLARAAYHNVRQRRIVEGGSTITQQLAKGLFLTRDKSVVRKLKEAMLALALERRYAKDQILEMYLNEVYFGHGAYGVEAAARTYFDKSVVQLSLSEAALLAGLPRAPALYSPFNHPELARQRRAQVLHRMADVGLITPTAARHALATDPRLVPPQPHNTTGQYFIQYVRSLLAEQYGDDLVFKGGLKVYTALSPPMQSWAEEALRGGLRTLQARHRTDGAYRPGASDQHPQGALVTIEPRTGRIRAMVGGIDFSHSEFNRAVQARRQAGSVFKPFVYLAALEAGLTPATRVDDSPVTYALAGNGKSWQPENLDRKFRGPITLERALEESVNVVTVKLQQRIGLQRTIDVARRLGITSPLHEDLTIALGSSDLSLLELTVAYAALANQGFWIPPTPIRYVTDGQGRPLQEDRPEGRQAISRELAYLITHMLKGVVERGTAEAATVLGRPIAGKTGTTNGYTDAWFIGYTPDLVTGVWVGYDRPRSLGVDETGGRAALPIWVNYMGKVSVEPPPQDFPTPENVVFVSVDLDSAEGCTRPVKMAFLRGTEPSTSCGGLLDALRRFSRPPLSPSSASQWTRPPGDKSSSQSP